MFRLRQRCAGGGGCVGGIDGKAATPCKPPRRTKRNPDKFPEDFAFQLTNYAKND